MQNTKFILASASPRRYELLGELGIIPAVAPTDADENVEENISPEDTVELLSRRKADAYPLPLNENEILISADTVVALENDILGKPRDRDDATAMLTSLSGRTHKVCTGVTLRNREKSITAHDSTSVTFRAMTEKEIADYVDSGDPMDKAGAYGIQGEAEKFVESTEGSLNNVIGLPTELIKNILINEFDIEF